MKYPLAMNGIAGAISTSAKISDQRTRFGARISSDGTAAMGMIFVPTLHAAAIAEWRKYAIASSSAATTST